MNQHRHIVILTEYGARIGFGHLTRCVAISEALRADGNTVDIWAAPDAADDPERPEFSRRVRWYDPTAEMARELGQADAVLIDSFAATPGQVERFFAINGNMAFVDDYCRRGYRRGCVVDWTVGAERLAYPQRHPGVTYLLGSRYCALRPEFRHGRVERRAEHPESVLVSLGGSDVRNLTTPVVDMLQREFPGLTKHVVVGSGFRRPSAGSSGWDDRTLLHTSLDAGGMQALMARSDLAVCCGGQTLYELASQGLPPVVIGAVDNARDDITGFVGAGFAACAGSWDEEGLLAAVGGLLRELWPRETRERRAARGRALVDGNGGARLAEALSAAWDEAALLGVDPKGIHNDPVASGAGVGTRGPLP